MKNIKNIFNEKEPKCTKTDYIILTIILLFYSTLSFINLGSFDNPQTFYTFNENENITIELPSQTDIIRLRLYNGELSGKYSIYISKDNKEKVAKAFSDIFELDYEKTLKKVRKRSSIETIVKKMDKEKTNELRIWMKENNITSITMKHLENLGYTITYLSVNKNGQINLNELENSITKSTCLITIMMANNEIGNIYPIKEIGQKAKENNILFHCDAVQAVGKIEIDVNEMNIDTLSLSGHKINAPKGIGVLYKKNNIPFIPLIFGHQENERRGGTENTAYIIGLGKAVQILLGKNEEENKKLKDLRDYMEKEIQKNIDDIIIYGDLNNRLPNTSSIAFKGVNAEELLIMLESFNIFVSTGSACNSTLTVPSHVLTACNADLINYSPIRISLGKYNTKEEINIFIKRLINIVNTLRKNKK